MNINSIKYLAFSAVVGLALTSCDDFLDKPTEDSYTSESYYGSDEECIAGVNYLYNSPWYDFQRGFIKVGEVLSGNYYWGSSPYLTFTVNGSDEDLVNMSASLWAVIGHTNTVYDNIKAASGPSQSVKNQCMGECLAWKAMAYFYLVRSFGEVPIVHNNSETLNSGAYSTTKKVWRSDVYDYIIMTLEKAMELLPKSSDAGRIDYYCAEGLLAKVYLTKAGVKGSLNADDLSKAAKYAKDVIDNSGRKLLDNYEDVFRLANNKSEESLFAWRWTANGNVWTAQNTLQSDLGMAGFDEFGDCWGQYAGISVDLQEAFGVKLLEQTPDTWANSTTDVRRHGTMMLPGDTYSYFWTDKTMKDGSKGFNYLQFIYDTKYNGSSGEVLYSATGSNTVKHLYGDAQDHLDATGVSPAYMYSSLATHILRLSDVYLVYAEAMLGTGNQTSDASALDAFYAVRHRAVSSYAYPSAITRDDIWKERRLEFAMEGDRWYDFVRVSYYNPDKVVAELKAQKRNAFYNLDATYKNYWESNTWNITVDETTATYDTKTSAPNVIAMMKAAPSEEGGKQYFYLPFTAEDVVFNPNLGSNVAGEHVDVRATYSY